MKKIILSIFTVIGLLPFITSCGSKLVSSTSKYFEILNATETHWSAGTIDAGRGVDYHVFLDLGKDTPVFDTGWVDHQKLAVDATLNSKRKDIKLMEVHLGYTIDNNSSTKEILSPIHYKGKALIRYRVGGKTKYLLIKEFVLQKPINFQ